MRREPLGTGGDRADRDPAQSDLLPELSGLKDMAEKLEVLSDIAVVRLAEVDIVRHPLVASMIEVI